MFVLFFLFSLVCSQSCTTSGDCPEIYYNLCRNTECINNTCAYFPVQFYRKWPFDVCLYREDTCPEGWRCNRDICSCLPIHEEEWTFTIIYSKEPTLFSWGVFEINLYNKEKILNLKTDWEIDLSDWRKYDLVTVFPMESMERDGETTIFHYYYDLFNLRSGEKVLTLPHYSEILK